MALLVELILAERMHGGTQNTGSAFGQGANGAVEATGGRTAEDSMVESHLCLQEEAGRFWLYRRSSCIYKRRSELFSNINQWNQPRKWTSGYHIYFYLK